MARFVMVFLIVAGILMVQAMADKSEVNTHGVKSQAEVEPTGVVAGTADQPESSPSESSDHESKAAEAPQIRRLGKHHSSDKSVAGGGVIIGGLVTAIFAAVFCYIRVTRKRNAATN
ncbi:Basic helix-loop-helix DNA-binding superfamily protein [Melia azedarach]|uniref:Basic helix-loop-helix DNA-binding superfamily protein n=1 Tax=Melia azedarach TaxID=155640 RepID=A0ACC1Z3C4_MELAZ|nr:Basic helix-loop-helix DNA-binding superfamily protein [Melia azedarach]